MEVLVGIRVVRGPDWSWRDQDGGEGHLGTVAEVQVQEQVETEGGRAPCVATVQWDCGNRCRYRCGLGGKYDLRGFDSGPAGVVHPGQVCNGCGMDPITGMMWKCVRCHEYNICTDCYMTGKHILEHEFDRFVTPHERVRVPARGYCKRKEIRGIFKFAEVVPWCDWESQEGTEASEKGGEVIRLCGKNDDNTRAFVEVQWTESEEKTTHMVGHEGKVELKCTEPTSGGYYYPEHLPLLGAPLPSVDPAAVSTGDLVRVELEPDVFQAVQEGHGGWSDVMLEVIGKIGTVVGISESGDLKIRYPENLIWTLCPEAVVKVDVPRFKVGDLVRISGDLEKVQRLQGGHGDWSDGVLLLLGEVGRVYTVYSGGDVMVMVTGKSWVFNPLCLSPASDSREEDSPITKWAKADADESMKYGLQTMLRKGQGTLVPMATSLGEVAILREFLTKYPKKVDAASSGRTALHYAASAGLAEPMKILIEFKADLEQQDDTSMRALHMSASYGHNDCIQLLVDAGAEVNAQTLDGSTPAMLAAMHGNARTLKILLKSPDIKVSIQDEVGNTALHAAVMSQRLPCVLPLLDAGADPFMLNFSLITSLHLSARMGFLPVLEAFLQRFPDDGVTSMDGYSHTILQCAALQDHPDIITLAMDLRGCDVDARNDYGQTALHIAIARGNTKSIEKLITYGASVNAVDADGCSPLHYITSRDTMEPPSEDCPMIYKLHKALFGRFLEDNVSMMYGIIAVAALLVRKGADIHQNNKNGRSPYHYMPFIATLMTVLADNEDIIEQGGHPDGSPLLRLTNTTDKTYYSGSGRGKKSRGSSHLMYQDSSDESPSSDYYGGHGGQSGGRTFMIFARTSPSGYTEGSSNASNASSTSSGYSSSRGGGGSREAMSSGGMGESLYKNYTQSYGYSSHGCAHEDYQPKNKSNSPKTTSSSGPGYPSTSTSSPTATPSSSGATPGYSGAGSRQSGVSRSSTSDPHSSASSSASASASASAHAPPSTASTTPTSAGGISHDLCFMCDNNVDVRFFPCGHAAMCSECVPKAKRCPICKVAVDGTYTAVCVNCRKKESEVRQNCGHGICHGCAESRICAGCQEPD